jgi:putative transcriptional regulator
LTGRFRAMVAVFAKAWAGLGDSAFHGTVSEANLSPMKKPKRTRKSSTSGPSFLEGQLLIAMPGMTDKRFARSVVYLCAHSAKGAMGLIINQRAEHISFSDLLKQLEIVKGSDKKQIITAAKDRHVHVGGPVETGRGFVLHSADYFSEDSTLPIDNGVCLTATVDILKAIVTGGGPGRSILALGYAGWGAGQLESEIQANGWLHCAADPDLIFGTDVDAKYARAMSKIGVDPAHLVNAAGHA